ncbi:MAG: hypothetical protein KDF60_04115 [Calditrichaeota bacterium]|nr:hypothetical protein [Calditrichota bacterium]
MKTVILILFLVPAFILAQSSWRREIPIVKPREELFHSVKTANLPTAETLQKGNFFYEISHRFARITAGYDALYGLDGPVNMRTALSYGVTDDWMVTIGRSNVQDNLEFNVKYLFWDIADKTTPSRLTLKTGIAFNTEAIAGTNKRDAFNSNSTQYYIQVIFNTMLLEKSLGLGVVPSYVYNSYIFANDFNENVKYTFSLPLYVQYYFNRTWSLWLEYMPVIGGWKGNIYSDPSSEKRSYNALSAGLALETGGHVFHLFVTNSTRLNPTQYLVGADNNTNKDAWHFAFGITREL